MSVLFPSRGFRRTRERASGLLFAFGVDDLSTDLPTGQTLSLTRASGRTVYDASGRVQSIAHSQWPWSMQYNSTAAVWEPVLDLQPTTTNLCLQSENFGTTWAAVGTPTRTAAATTCGDLSLDLIGDDASGTLEGYTQTVTFTANAVKAVSLFLKAGTSTSTVVRLRDTTASANRLLAVITWASGVPTVTMTTGTSFGTIACYGSVYRFLFQTTSVTAANTNSLEVYPATTSALAASGTGTVYAGGVQAENAVAPGSYRKTTTATASNTGDLVSATVVVPVTSAFTVYLRVARPFWSGVTSGWSGTMLLFGQASSVTNGWWLIELDPINQRVNASLGQAGSGQVSYRTIPSTGLFDVCVQYRNLTTAGQSRIDIGDGNGFAAYSSTVAAISQWDSTTTYLGDRIATSQPYTGIRRAIIASGERTLSEMQGLAV